MTISLLKIARPGLPILGSLLIASLTILGVALETNADDDVRLDIAFVTHLDMNLAEQDVYIERVKGSGKVYR